MNTMENTKEEWRKIKINSNYEVSSLGRVRHIKTGNIITLYGRNFGSKFCTLSESGATHTYSVARLMIMAFRPEEATLQKYKIYYRDNNPENLTLDNLEVREIKNKKSYLVLKKYIHIVEIDVDSKDKIISELKQRFAYDIKVTKDKASANMRYLKHTTNDNITTILFVECYENKNRSKYIDFSLYSLGYRSRLVDEVQFNNIMLDTKNII